MADFVCWYPQRQSFESGSLLLDFAGPQSAAEAFVESYYRRYGPRPPEPTGDTPQEVRVAQVRVMIEDGRPRPVPDDTKVQAWLVDIVPSVAFEARRKPAP